MLDRIKVCLNGGRRRAEHPAVPITPAESAAAAAASVAAGAQAVHLHPRDRAGDESLRAEDVGAAVTAVRRACPGVPVGVSTGLWITDGDAGARRDLVAGWAGLPAAGRPDFASVNVVEGGFGELAGVLRDAGIAVEAGVWSTADAEALAGMEAGMGRAGMGRAGMGRAGVIRVLVEIIGGSAAEAVPSADAILRRLDDLRVSVPRLVHGEEAACWPLVEHAGRLGLPTRIGLEDTVVGPGGGPVAGNAELVRVAVGLWTAARASGGG